LLLELAGFLVDRTTGNYSLDEPFQSSDFVMAVWGRKNAEATA
jgi:hypothetical protein